MSSRKSYEQKYNGRYTKIGSIGNPCTYCGVTSQAMDHVPNISIAGSVPIGTDFVKVPACNECNSLLQRSDTLTVSDRKRELKKLLAKRYKKLIKSPVWNEDELEELSPSLRLSIEQAAQAKASIKDRLNW